MQFTNFKNRSERHFNNSSLTYDEASFVQDKYSYLLSKKIKSRINFIPKNILDVGCGTGTTSFFLKKIYPQSDFFLNDISSSMLDIAKKKIKPREIICCDADCYSFNKCDLLISNFALHWLNDIIFFLKRSLSFAKYLCCSALLDGTFASWYSILNESVKKYVKPKELEDFFSSSGVSFYEIEYFEEKISFESVESFIRYIKMLGVGGYISNKKNFISAVRDFNGEISTSYKIAVFFIKNT